jgi:hypothetical protein
MVVEELENIMVMFPASSGCFVKFAYISADDKKVQTTKG